MRIVKPLDWQVIGSTGLDVVVEGEADGPLDCVLWRKDDYFALPSGQRPVLARVSAIPVRPGLFHARFDGLAGWGTCVLGVVSPDWREVAVCGVLLGDEAPGAWLRGHLVLTADEARQGIRWPLPAVSCALSHIAGDTAEPVETVDRLPALLAAEAPGTAVLPLLAPETVEAGAALDDAVDLSPRPDPARHPLATTQYRASAPYLAHLRDAVVILPAGLVLPDGDRVWSDSTHAAFWQDPNCAQYPNLFRADAGLGLLPDRVLTERDLLADNERERMPGTPLLAFGNAYRNHGHWLMNTVFAAWLLREAINRGEVCVLVPGLSEYVLDTLRAAGIPRRAILAARPGTYRFARALYPSTLSIHANTHPPRAMAAMFRDMAAFAAGQPGNPGPPLVYLTRDGANTQRTIGNEAALVEALRARGFAVVAPHALSVMEEIRCLAGARVVVGQLGAGMLNVGFAPPGCRVVEIASDNYCADDTWFLAAVGGQRYSRLLVDGGRPEAMTLGSFRFDVPLAPALALVDDVLARTKPGGTG